MIQGLIGFASGVGVAVIAAVLGAVLQRRHERQRHVDETQFRVYMGLLDVYSLYFWVSSLELTGEQVDVDLRRQIRAKAWKIADQLRAEDAVPHTADILRVLMSNEFRSASERHRAMGDLVDKLGAVVNPRYQRAVKAISAGNVIRIGSGDASPTRSTTPGFMDTL